MCITVLQVLQILLILALIFFFVVLPLTLIMIPRDDDIPEEEDFKRDVRKGF
ncbi:hypothetical protein LCGC14_0698930 [marine sediment metagenome]|uniref:Uncharacterized protein n=1 Tax=marine sediment metagenome TaxID=412755 RepID=A0A0F9QN77_9ZZZZ